MHPWCAAPVILIVIYATLLAPLWVGRVLAQLAVQRGTAYDIRRFAPARFAGGDAAGGLEAGGAVS